MQKGNLVRAQAVANSDKENNQNAANILRQKTSFRTEKRSRNIYCPDEGKYYCNTFITKLEVF